jgi:hypothetical protein
MHVAAVGRKKIRIEKITDERNRQVGCSLLSMPHLKLRTLHDLHLQFMPSPLPAD